MNTRLAQFQEILKQNKLDGFIVTNQTNILYLTGFKGISLQERESILVFNPKPTLITARLYQNEAKKVACRNLKIKIAPERNQIFEYAKQLLKNVEKVGFEENDLRFSEHQELKSYLGSDPIRPNSSSLKGPTLKPNADLVEQMRTIKNDEELKRIEKAQIISQKAFEQLLKTLKIGQTEEEIAQRLSKIIKSLGGQGLAFESIVASGPNAGLPHYVTGKRKNKKGEVLLLDFGAKYQNYLGDLSRTVFIGKANDKLKNIYKHVLTAQRAAIGKIRSGVKSSEVYNEANNHFKRHALERHFLHGAGHGIGLEIHENPYLRPENHNPLLENMVTSVEPGLYFPWGGIRIEDLVTVGKSHAAVLGRESPELIEIS